MDKIRTHWKIVVASIVIITIIVGLVMIINKFFRKPTTNKQSGQIKSTLKAADPNIKVDLKPADLGKTLTLTITNYPSDITSIEYELTYQTENNKQEGVFGQIKLENREKSIQRELTLGTCSSGVCRYHNLTDGLGLLTIKFNSPKGASRFQKEFKLI